MRALRAVGQIWRIADTTACAAHLKRCASQLHSSCLKFGTLFPYLGLCCREVDSRSASGRPIVQHNIVYHAQSLKFVCNTGGRLCSLGRRAVVTQEYKAVFIRALVNRAPPRLCGARHAQRKWTLQRYVYYGTCECHYRYSMVVTSEGTAAAKSRTRWSSTPDSEVSSVCCEEVGKRPNSSVGCGSRFLCATRR